MALVHSDLQALIAEESRRALSEKVTLEALLDLVERPGAFFEPGWSLAVEQGWVSAVAPVCYGGLGLGLSDAGIITQEAGRVVGGSPYLTGAIVVSHALSQYAAKPVKARWLPRICSGEQKAISLMGEHGVEGCSSLHWSAGVVSGGVGTASGGAQADLLLALIMEGGVPRLVLIELDGAVRLALESIDNLRGVSELGVDTCPAHLLLEGNEARHAASEILALHAVLNAHEQAGGCLALLELARDFVLERKAFGQPIGKFQAVKHAVAEMYGQAELALAAAQFAAERHHLGDISQAAAAAKLQASNAYTFCARTAIHVHGGIGVTFELGLHLHMRRARSLALEAGGQAYWEDVLVEQIIREN